MSIGSTEISANIGKVFTVKEDPTVYANSLIRGGGEKTTWRAEGGGFRTKDNRFFVGSEVDGARVLKRAITERNMRHV